MYILIPNAEIINHIANILYNMTTAELHFRV